MALQALIIDLDDTLLIDIPATQNTLENLGQWLGLDPKAFAESTWEIAKKHWQTSPVYDFTKSIGHSASEGLWSEYSSEHPEFQKLGKWIPTYRQNTWSESLKTFGLDDPKLAEQASERYIEERSENQKLFPGTLETLEKLKSKYKLALLTNGNPDLQWFKIKATGLEPYFDPIIISGEFGIGKPDPRIFKFTLQKLGLKPSEVLMIGNNPIADIEGASQANIRSILFGQNAQKTEAGEPPTSIKKISELLTLKS